MRISGEFQVGVGRERVWASFWEDDAIRAWVPGCRAAEWQGRERVRGEVEQSLAQLKAQFVFDLEVTASEAPGHLSLRGRGEGTAIASTVEVSLEITLEPLEEEVTLVRYAMEAEISGKLALAGNLVLKLKARELQREMAAGVKEYLEK